MTLKDGKTSLIARLIVKFGGTTLLICCLAQAAAPEGQAFESNWLSSSSEALTTKSVQLLLSVAWEGRDLQTMNLEAIRQFHRSFPDITLVHLVSPAYLIGPQGMQNALAIKSTMAPGDKVGVLLSGWKSIVEGARVPFRAGPTMWGEELRAIDCTLDCGQDVPVSAYTDEEINKIVAFSIETLDSHGFGTPTALLSSGWLSSPAILTAALQHRVHYDFSAAPPSLIESRASPFPLFGWVKNLWSSITPLSQPFETATEAGSIIQVPQNLAAMDYLVDGQVLSLFKDFDKKLTAQPGVSLVFHLSAYQETAFQTMPLLAKTLQEVIAYAESHKISMQRFDLPGPSAPTVPEALNVFNAPVNELATPPTNSVANDPAHVAKDLKSH